MSKEQYISMMRKTLNAVNVLSQPQTYEDKIKQEIEEGRVKGMMMDMEDDAADMSKAEFIKKHGESQADVWHQVQEDEGVLVDE